MVPARAKHVNTIANRLREIDVLECAVMGHSPKGALRTGLLGSTVAWTVLIDGHPEAMMGASPISITEGRGRPWLLMTDVAARQMVSLVRLGARYTYAMHQQYPLLENWIHADNTRSMRWLARLGYTIGATDVIRGQPMRRFVRARER